MEIFTHENIMELVGNENIMGYRSNQLVIELCWLGCLGSLQSMQGVKAEKNISKVWGEPSTYCFHGAAHLLSILFRVHVFQGWIWVDIHIGTIYETNLSF